MNTTLSRPSIRTLWVSAVIAVVTLLPGEGAWSSSLYNPDRPRSMFADRKARAVGDVITIQIIESTVASQDADSDVQRRFSGQAEGGSGLFGLFDRLPKATLGGNINHKGSGTTTRSSRLVSTITCRVAEITPGGQLVVTGERSVRVNADTQMVRFRGVIRSEDVNPDNTVSSSLVADAQVEVVGKGPISRNVKPGLLTRIFDFLF
jgi:flagellar L-ring protein precursor FlgH